MFVPPESRLPGPPPPGPPPGPSPKRRKLTAREQTVVLWVIGIQLVLAFVAPLGGSTVLEALWYLLRA